MNRYLEKKVNYTTKIMLAIFVIVSFNYQIQDFYLFFFCCCLFIYLNFNYMSKFFIVKIIQIAI